MNGILVALKPPGMTSHAVVAFIRRLMRVKVGHTGTLDPTACGVLTLCIGQGTKLAEFLVQDEKTYRAEITFGATTDTQDAEGQVLSRASSAHLTEAEVRSALETLVGDIAMPVPVYSAVKRNGRKLYEAARRGIQLEAPIRVMHIDRICLLQFIAGEGARALVEINCAKGTYVRSISTRLGERLGCGAYLSFLLRTRVGKHTLRDALTLEEIESLWEAKRLQNEIVDLAQALPHFPLVGLDWGSIRRLSHGNPCIIEGGAVPTDAPLRVVNPFGTLVCIADAVASDFGGYIITPRKVFNI